MKVLPVPEVDYRRLRPSNITQPPYKHLLYLLFWPVFGLLFAYVERLQGARVYAPVWCPLDDVIPFCEWFVIPYLFWFVYLVGTLAYGVFFDVNAMKRMMRFILFTFSVTIVIYLLFPTCQELRPASFARDNLFTRFMAWFYTFDTNTNVCPSMHVLGSVAALGAAWHSKAFSSTGWRVFFAVSALLISLSTVFLKQHSAFDVLAAIPLSVAGWYLFFLPDKRAN